MPKIAPAQENVAQEKVAQEKVAQEKVVDICGHDLENKTPEEKAADAKWSKLEHMAGFVGIIVYLILFTIHQTCSGCSYDLLWVLMENTCKSTITLSLFMVMFEVIEALQVKNYTRIASAISPEEPEAFFGFVELESDIREKTWHKGIVWLMRITTIGISALVVYSRLSGLIDTSSGWATFSDTVEVFCQCTLFGAVFVFVAHTVGATVRCQSHYFVHCMLCNDTVERYGDFGNLHTLEIKGVHEHGLAYSIFRAVFLWGVFLSCLCIFVLVEPGDDSHGNNLVDILNALDAACVLLVLWVWVHYCDALLELMYIRGGWYVPPKAESELPGPQRTGNYALN